MVLDHFPILRCYKRGKREKLMMQCPECGERDLMVDVVFTGSIDILVSDDGEFEVTDSEPGDSEWSDDSRVNCYGCRAVTTVKAAKAAWDKAHGTAEVTDDDPRED